MVCKHKELILAYDFGTSGVKACLFTPDGNMVSRTFSEYPTLLLSSSHAEQDPHDWWSATVRCTRSLLRSHSVGPGAIRGIGISGHMMGCLPVDREGTPIRNSMIHSDMRSANQCRRLGERLGINRVYEITGNRLDPRYSICKIVWLKENEPEVYDKTAMFVQCKEYIIFKLTGVLGYTDYSDASLAGYLDIHRREISQDVITAAEISRGKLPEVVSSTTMVGHVSAEAAEVLGLENGIPVSLGGGDGACASVGAGAVDDGDTYNYLGSTSWINVVASRPLFDPNRRVFHLYSLEPTKLNLGGSIQTAGSSYRWVKDQLGYMETYLAKQLNRSPYELLDMEATLIPPGAEGLIFLPYLMGEKTPIWDTNARGVFFGLSLNHGRNHLTRAVLEGVGYALRSVIESFEELGVRINDVNLTGGGATGNLWPTVLSDIFGRRVLIRSHASDAPALGAAVAAGIGCGWYRDFIQARQVGTVVREIDPDMRIHRQYSEFYSIYRGLYQALKEQYQLLASISTV